MSANHFSDRLATLSRYVVLALACYLTHIPICAQNFVDIKPTPAQVEWQDLEIGVIIHFGTNTFLDREWGDGTADPLVFNPSHVNTDQWMNAAKAAGAKYAVMVAKHHDGFALWPSTQTTYSVKQSPWLDGKGDLIRMATNSAHRAGLGFGVYLSPWDRHDKRYSDPVAYDKYYLAQLDELSTQYGPLTEFWIDGAGSAGRTYDFDTIINELRIYQPNTLVFADVALYKNADLRWVGNESGEVTFENWNVIDRAGYLRWRPVEADTPLHRDHWFWHADDEATLRSVDDLMEIYTKTVGKGAQLMLGLAPDSTGQLPAADVKRLHEFGDAVHSVYAHNLVAESGHISSSANGTESDAVDNNPETFWVTPADHGLLEIHFDKSVTFDRAVIMERLNEGQHVADYSIEAWQNGAWKTLVRGHAIGHKKIDIWPLCTTQRVRLRLLSTTGSAAIREFQLFNGVGSSTP